MSWNWFPMTMKHCSLQLGFGCDLEQHFMYIFKREAAFFWSQATTWLLTEGCALLHQDLRISTTARGLNASMLQCDAVIVAFCHLGDILQCDWQFTF